MTRPLRPDPGPARGTRTLLLSVAVTPCPLLGGLYLQRARRAPMRANPHPTTLRLCTTFPLKLTQTANVKVIVRRTDPQSPRRRLPTPRLVCSRPNQPAVSGAPLIP